MALQRHEIVTSGHQGGAVSHTQHQVERAKKIKRTYQKRKEGTEGLDATDERCDSDRLNEGFELLRED